MSWELDLLDTNLKFVAGGYQIRYLCVFSMCISLYVYLVYVLVFEFFVSDFVSCLRVRCVRCQTGFYSDNMKTLPEDYIQTWKTDRLQNWLITLCKSSELKSYCIEQDFKSLGEVIEFVGTYEVVISRKDQKKRIAKNVCKRVSREGGKKAHGGRKYVRTHFRKPCLHRESDIKGLWSVLNYTYGKRSSDRWS